MAMLKSWTALILLYLLVGQIGYCFEWEKGDLDHSGLNKKAFHQFVEYAFSTQNPAVRTEILLLARDGKIVFERYTHGFEPQSKHRVWSVSKSFVGAVYGILAQQGRVQLDQKVQDFLPEFKKTAALKQVTIKHLLQMNSGIAWNESYFNPIVSNVIKMLYGEKKENMGGYAALIAATESHEALPGEQFKYSSGTSNLLMYLFKQIIGNLNLHNHWPWTHLFEPLGMQHVAWEQDYSGTFVGSSYLFTTARDLARFGQLYLQDGIFDDKRILPPGWVKQSVTPSLASAKNNEWYGYGMHFWTNRHADGRVRHKGLPADTFFSLGHNGQILMMIPSKQIVMVRMGHDTQRMDRDAFFDQFAKVLK